MEWSRGSGKFLRAAKPPREILAAESALKMIFFRMRRVYEENIIIFFVGEKNWKLFFEGFEKYWSRIWREGGVENF